MQNPLKFLPFSLIYHLFNYWVYGFFFLQFFGEHLDLQCLQQGFTTTTTDSLRFGEAEEEEAHTLSSIPTLEDRMPFLQMLQSVDSPPPPYFPLKEPSFQALLRLQHFKKPWECNKTYMPEMETQLLKLLEFESCVTTTNHHDMVELHSPVKSEVKDFHQTLSVSAAAGGLEDQENNYPNSAENLKSPPASRERKKRKRTRPTKNKEEVESQRMTHIAVERNRRRQMNDHLNVLRSLMPPSYIQRVLNFELFV